jgi:hypothetical protein
MLSYFIKKILKILHFRTYRHSYPNLVTGSPVMMSSRISHGRSSNSILFTNMGNQFLFPTCAKLKLFFCVDNMDNDQAFFLFFKLS